MEGMERAMRSVHGTLARRDFLMIGAVWLVVAAMALAGALSARYLIPPTPAGAGTVPGFASAGGVDTCLPFSSYCGVALVLVPPDTPKAAALKVKLRANVIDAETLAELPVPVLRGRLLRPYEFGRDVAAAVINESMARYLWPDDESVGRRIRVCIGNSAPRWVEIVGVVPDMSFGRDTVSHVPTLYLSSRQFDLAVKIFFASDSEARGIAGA